MTKCIPLSLFNHAISQSPVPMVKAAVIVSWQLSAQLLYKSFRKWRTLACLKPKPYFSEAAMSLCQDFILVAGGRRESANSAPGFRV